MGERIAIAFESGPADTSECSGDLGPSSAPVFARDGVTVGVGVGAG
jgi:hypothetical protein